MAPRYRAQQFMMGRRRLDGKSSKDTATAHGATWRAELGPRNVAATRLGSAWSGSIRSIGGTTAMSEAATYSAGEALRDGRWVEIRALRPNDRADLITAVGRTSANSFYRRFFGVRHEFTEREIASYLNIDFVNHVALVAAMDEGERPTIVGGAGRHPRGAAHGARAAAGARSGTRPDPVRLAQGHAGRAQGGPRPRAARPAAPGARHRPAGRGHRWRARGSGCGSSCARATPPTPTSSPLLGPPAPRHPRRDRPRPRGPPDRRGAGHG